MGFPNVDKLLVKLFMDGFETLKADPELIVADTFEDLDEDERGEILLYISRKEFTTDTRNREGSLVYIMPNYPLSELPFPQIGISLGSEDSDRYMGDLTGDSSSIEDAQGNVTHWGTTKGYLARSNWMIHHVTATKDEAIWLSRLTQRFICEAFLYLETKGVSEVGINIQDLVVSEGTLQPSIMFNRASRMTAIVQNSWTTYKSAGIYQTGINMALET